MWATIALSALNALSGISARKKAVANQIEANKKTALGYIQGMNYSFQNYEEQRQQLFAQAVDDLTHVRFQSRRQEAQVDAAVNEEDMGGGRTADLLKRSTRNDEARAASSVVGNYQAQNDEIDLNKETTLINTKNAIDSIPSVNKPSTASYLMGAASSFVDTYNALDAIHMRHAKDNVGASTNLFSQDSVFAQSPAEMYYTFNATGNSDYVHNYNFYKSGSNNMNRFAIQDLLL